MAEKSTSINVQLKLDTKGFSARLDGLARDFKPLNVPVKFDTKNSTIRAELDTSTLKSAFDEVGESISKVISTSVNSLKPNAFSGLMSSITAPFQSIARGALEGIGRDVSTKFGAGLAKGIQIQASPIIGSFDLLGEKLVTTAIPRLKNTIGGKIAGSLFGREEVKESASQFKQFLKSTIGETDLLISQESGKAIASRQKQGQLKIARKALGIQLAEFVGNAPQRMQQVVGLKSRDKQLEVQQQDAQSKAADAAAALAAKNQQLQAKQDAILKKAESSGTKVDEKLRSQVRKRILGSAKTTEEVAQLEINNAKALSALSSIVAERNKISAKIAQLSNPVSSVTGKLELLGISSEEIKAARQKVDAVAKETKKIITSIDNSLSQDVSKIDNLQKEIGVYKQQLQNLLNDFNFQLNFVESKPEQEELLKQTIQKRKQILEEIQQLEQQISALIQAGKQKKQLYTEAEQKREIRISEANQQAASTYKTAQIKIAREAISGKKVGGITPNKQPEISTVKLQNIYENIISKVSEVSGISIKKNDIPQLTTRNDIPIGGGGYEKSTNQILIDKNAYKKLLTGVIDEKTVEVLVHELRHALQFEFGKNLKATGFKLAEPTKEESPRLQDRISQSVNLAIASSGRTNFPEGAKKIIEKTEADAYVFADRYAKEIYDFIQGVTNVAPTLKAKLSAAQKEIAASRKQAAQDVFDSLISENQANLQQLNTKQLKQIAKSSGLSNYSGKKKAELQELLASQIKPEELAFRIPLFSKTNPLNQKDAAELAKLAPEQLKIQIKELSASFKKTTVTAGKEKNSQTLREVLDGISQARNIYAAALATDISKESRQFLQSAIASLGRQRIAAQSRLTALDATQLNSSQTVPRSINQPLGDLLFSVPNNPNKSNLPVPPPPPSMEEILKRVKQRQPGQFNQVNASLKAMEANAEATENIVSKFVQKVNAGISGKIKNANDALQKLTKLTTAAEEKQKKRSQQITKSSEVSFQQSREALKQLEVEANRQVSQIEASQRYKEQQRAKSQRDRLQGYGINQTAPVELQEAAPQRQPFSAGKLFNQAKTEIADLRSQSARKQASILGNQAAAILVDLDSQTAIGKAAVAEAKVINKQIAQNEKQIQKILNTVKASKEGRIPQLTGGDLQRLSGKLQELSSTVGTDRQRIAQLEPTIQKAKQIQPVRQSLQTTSEKANNIASQKQLSNEDLQRLNQYNKQLRQSLNLLGAAPPNPPGGLFDFNAKIPGMLKNVFNLVKGFLAFQILNTVQSQLQQVAVEAFQTSMRFEALEKSLLFVSGSEGDSAANLAFVRKEVERLSLPLEVSIKAFTALTAAARGTSLEGAQTQKIFTAIAQASRVFGLSSEQTEGALLAVQQMISKGTVNAEELRGQLGERLPGAFNIFARAMGITTQELNKQLELGNVGLDDLAKFAAQLEKETAGGVEGATKTSAASLQRLQNQITDFNRSVGDAIAPAAIVAFDILGNSLDFVQKNAKLVRAAVIGMAGALTILMLPSIIAVGSALLTLATTTLPLATTAMIAFVAANPVAIAGILALTAGMIVAEDAAKNLANALNGVTQAQLDQGDKDVSFDSKLAEGQSQLIKQIPLTKEKLAELTAGLEDQANRGVRSAKSSQIFVNQLKRMQAQAEATAKAQNDLNKSVNDADIAFKKNKIQIEQAKLQGELISLKSRASGATSEEGMKDKEYQIEQVHNQNLLSSYNTRISHIQGFLKQSQELQKAGKKGLDPKQEKELREELLNVQKEYSQAEINLLKSKITQQKELQERRLKDFDEAEQIQDSYRKAGLVNEQQAIEALLSIRQGKALEELAQIAEKRKKLNKTDKEGLESLAVQEAAILAKMADNRKSRFDEQFNVVKSATDRANAYLEAKQKQGLRSEQQAAFQSVAIASQSAKGQLMLIQQRLAETPATDTATRDELLVQEQQALAAVAEAKKNAHSRLIGDLKSKEEFELALITTMRSQSLLTEKQYNQQQYKEKNKALDEQVKLIQQRRSELNINDVEGNRELDKAELETYRQRTENQKAFLDSQLQQLEKNQQKAKDTVTNSVKERELEIQQLVNNRILNQEEAQAYLTQVTKNGITEELRAEQEKFIKLQSIQYVDPLGEEERQTKIRQSRIRTSELTLQLLQNEKQQQEAVFAAISKAYDRINQNIANGATRFIQPLERQLQLSNALEKSFDIQNKLLDARKGLYVALQNYVNADIQILQETAKTEEEKKQYAEAAASAKLSAARIQIEIDKQSLELQIKQADAAQRRLEVENAIAQIRNKADIAQKQVNLNKVKTDPNATQEQIDVAELELQASIAEGLGLREQSSILGQERAANAQINDARRRTQQLEGNANIRKAELDAANAIADERDKQFALNQLREKAARSLLGTNGNEAASRVEDFNLSNRGYALAPLQELFATQVRNAVTPQLPELILPQIQANNAFLTNVDNFGVAVNALMDFVSSKLATPTQVTITAPITNNIDSRNAGNVDISGQFRKQLYDLGLELNRKS